MVRLWLEVPISFAPQASAMAFLIELHSLSFQLTMRTRGHCTPSRSARRAPNHSCPNDELDFRTTSSPSPVVRRELANRMKITPEDPSHDFRTPVTFSDCQRLASAGGEMSAEEQAEMSKSSRLSPRSTFHFRLVLPFCLSSSLPSRGNVFLKGGGGTGDVPSFTLKGFGGGGGGTLPPAPAKAEGRWGGGGMHPEASKPTGGDGIPLEFKLNRDWGGGGGGGRGTEPEPGSCELDGPALSSR
mmetsp:Transcript_14419/g.35139  ORF Transcript_14419/g.35139 Transcript_14419/m.35139 type:complete len:243 (-) Transcript_14419:365-1093(-)